MYGPAVPQRLRLLHKVQKAEPFLRGCVAIIKAIIKRKQTVSEM